MPPEEAACAARRRAGAGAFGNWSGAGMASFASRRDDSERILGPVEERSEIPTTPPIEASSRIATPSLVREGNDILLSAGVFMECLEGFLARSSGLPPDP